jgi:hypothetical protein
MLKKTISINAYYNCSLPELSNYMDPGYPWEASSFPASQEISCILWNPRVFYIFRKITTRVPVLIRSATSTTSHPVFLRFVVIFSSHLLLGLPFLPFGLSYQNHACIDFLSHTCHKARPNHYLWFYHQNGIWWGAHDILAPYSIISSGFLTISQKCLSQNYVLQQPRPVFFLQRERPSFTANKETSKILVLCILIFIFTDS